MWLAAHTHCDCLPLLIRKHHGTDRKMGEAEPGKSVGSPIDPALLEIKNNAQSITRNSFGR